MNLIDEEWEPSPTDPALLRRVKAAVKGAVSPHDVSRLRAMLLAPPLNGAIPHEARGAVWLLLLGLRPEDLLAEDAGDFARAAREAVTSENACEQIERDVERTRPGLARFKQPAVRGALLRLLSLFCERKQVGYIQGLNELLAPFVLLADTGGNPRIVFSAFSAFLTRFAPWMLDSSESRVFDVLKRAFKYFGRLLLYHDPELFWWLEGQMMTPDLYATSWFVTLFARNFTVKTVLALWDLLLLEDNPLGTCFFGLALLLSRRQELLSIDPSRLPETLMMLGASTPEEVQTLWASAGELRAGHTPPSFQRLMSDRILNTPGAPNQKGLNAARCMQASVCLQTTPDDLTAGEAHYFTWDCRTKEEYESGHLAQAAFLCLDELRNAEGNRDANEAVKEELEHALGLCEPLRLSSHICLVGSGVKEEDDVDVNVLALYLTERGVPYVSTLRGGFRAAVAAANDDESLFSVELVDYDPERHEAATAQRLLARGAAAQRKALREAAARATALAAEKEAAIRSSLTAAASAAAAAVSSVASNAAGYGEYLQTGVSSKDPLGTDAIRGTAYPGTTEATGSEPVRTFGLRRGNADAPRLGGAGGLGADTSAEVDGASSEAPSEPSLGGLNRVISDIGVKFSEGFGAIAGGDQFATSPGSVAPSPSPSASNPFSPNSAASPSNVLEEFSSIVTVESGASNGNLSPRGGIDAQALPALRRSLSNGPHGDTEQSQASGFSSVDNSPRMLEVPSSAMSPKPGVQQVGDALSGESPIRKKGPAKSGGGFFGGNKSPWGRDARPGWLSDESLSLPLSAMPKGFTVNVMDDRVMAGLRLFPCRARSDRAAGIRGAKGGEFKRRYVGVCSNYFMLLSPHSNRSHLLEVKVIRFLQDIVRITFKRSRPELVTFEILGALEGDIPNEHIVCIMPDGLNECVDLIKEYLGQKEDVPSSTEGSGPARDFESSGSGQADTPSNPSDGSAVPPVTPVASSSEDTSRPPADSTTMSTTTSGEGVRSCGTVIPEKLDNEAAGGTAGDWDPQSKGSTSRKFGSAPSSPRGAGSGTSSGDTRELVRETRTSSKDRAGKSGFDGGSVRQGPLGKKIRSVLSEERRVPDEPLEEEIIVASEVPSAIPDDDDDGQSLEETSIRSTSTVHVAGGSASVATVDKRPQNSREGEVKIPYVGSHS